MFNKFNKFRLRGEVMDIGTGVMALRTVETSERGDAYSTEHLVMTAGLEAGIERGARVEVVGHLEQKDQRIVLVGEKLAGANDQVDENVCKVVGTAYRSFDFFPATDPGQVTFGSLLVKAGETIVRGVAFRQLASLLNKLAKRGSKVQLIGRLQERTYTDRDLNERKVVELICDPDRTKVLERAKIDDPFADHTTAEEAAPPEPVKEAPLAKKRTKPAAI